jgi:DNA-binding SARP family transcriptional activator
MSRLRLALLGKPEVFHGERSQSFPTRKVLALLVYLVVEKGLHSREKLSALLWPESEAREGGATLRSTIARLRTALEDAPDHSHLVVERDALGFHFTSDVDLDLAMLETAFKRCQASMNVDNLHGGTRRSLLVQLQAAVDCYRGGFLEGFHVGDAPDFEEWARLQREIWHRRMSVVFDRLSQAQFDGGELPSAIDTTTRWIAHEPLNESAHLRIMQVYFAAGDRFIPSTKWTRWYGLERWNERQRIWSSIASSLATIRAIASPICARWLYWLNTTVRPIRRLGICKRRHNWRKTSCCQENCGRFWQHWESCI